MELYGDRCAGVLTVVPDAWRQPQMQQLEQGNLIGFK